MKISSKKTILVAPLNWGLGHATRCIPIINGLLENNFDVLLGGDGASLQLLQREFPKLSAVILPSYKITYPTDGKHFKKQMFLKLPQIYLAAKGEQKAVKKLVESGQIHGSISDNRLGVRNTSVPSVYITHQLQVLSGATTYISSKMHQKYIAKFDACWVPDFKNEPSLSGRLGHTDINNKIKYLGPLSRMEQKPATSENDILVILSGPEPQRSLLEDKILHELANIKQRVLIVRGFVEEKEKWTTKGNITIVNYLTTAALEEKINASNLVVSRSGYTTVMDLFKLNKKAFFIPTPGQFEQEYLAKRFYDKKQIPFCNQQDFSVDLLYAASHFTGWPQVETPALNYKELFSIFQGKRKLAPYT